MEKFLGYRCSLCGTAYSPTEVTYLCPKDGGNLDVVLDYDDIRKNIKVDVLRASGESGLWKYLPLLPVADPGGQKTALRKAGGTPIYAPTRLAVQLGLEQLWIKDESLNPSASFKDRASAVVVSRAREVGAKVVITASTGNAGAALACMAAAIGQKAIIFAPHTAPQAKIAQLLIFGAQVLLVDGSYDDAFDLSIQAAQEFGWYCRNTGYNPFTSEGKKTAAFEIWDWCQCGNITLRSPLNIFIPVGDGNIISGIYKGFKDLAAIGWIEQIPRLFGVQAEGSAAITNAYNSGTETILPVSANTFADSISVDLPRDGVRAVRAVRETGGSYLLVSDADILDAMRELGKVGVFAEPAGAAAYAGLVEAVRQGLIGQNQPVLVLNTGSGLKDVKAAMQAATQPVVIEPTLVSLHRVIK